MMDFDMGVDVCSTCSAEYGDGDCTECRWYNALAACGSEERPPILGDVLWDRNLDDAATRNLVNQWWTATEAWGIYLGDALDDLQAIAPVGEPLPEGEGPLDVWRAAGGQRPDQGSWTVSREVADKCAVMIASPRGALLGYFSDPPVIWHGVVDRENVLGYF